MKNLKIVLAMGLFVLGTTVVNAQEQNNKVQNADQQIKKQAAPEDTNSTANATIQREEVELRRIKRIKQPKALLKQPQKMKRVNPPKKK